MRVFTILLLMLFATSVCFAEWDDIPLEDVVKKSDLIVVGTLSEVKEHSKNNVDYGERIIVIHAILHDKIQWKKESENKREQQKLILVWSNPTGLECPRVEHQFQKKRKGIWLLTVQKNGKVNADHPNRFQPIEKKSKILELLQGTDYQKE